jgi:hypothetical protein
MRLIHFNGTVDKYGKNHATMYQNMPKEYTYLRVRSELNWNINAPYFCQCSNNKLEQFFMLKLSQRYSVSTLVMTLCCCQL